MPITYSLTERSEANNLIKYPPILLTQNEAETRLEVESGNGPRMIILARRVCTLHTGCLPLLQDDDRAAFDRLLQQAADCVDIVIKCHNEGMRTDCDMERMKNLQYAINSRLLGL